MAGICARQRQYPYRRDVTITYIKSMWFTLLWRHVDVAVIPVNVHLFYRHLKIDGAHSIKSWTCETHMSKLQIRCRRNKSVRWWVKDRRQHETRSHINRLWKRRADNNNNNNNNNNHFFSANILEDRAQWRNKTKGLGRLVIGNNAWVVNGWVKKLGG